MHRQYVLPGMHPKINSGHTHYHYHHHHTICYGAAQSQLNSALHKSE